MTDLPRAGTTLDVMGDHLRFLATAAESGGAFTAVEITMSPGGARPRGGAQDDDVPAAVT